MNLTDLTEELQARADDAAPTVAMGRLTGVRHRIRVRRRRQAASAAGITAVCVAAVILFPGVSQLRADRVPTPSTTDAAPRPDDPLVFDANQAGDPLIAHGVSRPGASELVVRFTPGNTLLAISEFCRMPGMTSPSEGRAPFEYKMVINGHPFSGGDCQREDSANGSTVSYGDLDSKENRESWAELGVVPGRESVLRMTAKATKGTAAISPLTRLGVGVYALSGARVVDAGVSLKVQAEVDGHEYRLAGHTAAAATTKRRGLSLTTPVGAHPVMVLFGNPGGGDSDADAGKSVSLVVDGEQMSSSSGGGVASNELLEDARAHTIEVTLDPGLKGTMVLAYYVRVD